MSIFSENMFVRMLRIRLKLVALFNSTGSSFKKVRFLLGSYMYLHKSLSLNEICTFKVS